MTKKIIGTIVAIAALAAFIGAAVYAVTAYLNKKKCARHDEVYDNYVECCCEPDELSEVDADDDDSNDDVESAPVEEDAE